MNNIVPSSVQFGHTPREQCPCTFEFAPHTGHTRVAWCWHLAERPCAKTAMSSRRSPKSDTACPSTQLICSRNATACQAAESATRQTLHNCRQWDPSGDKTNLRRSSSLCSTTASTRSVCSRAIIALSASSAISCLRARASFPDLDATHRIAQGMFCGALRSHSNVVQLSGGHAARAKRDAVSSKEASGCVADRYVTHSDRNVTSLQDAAATLKYEPDRPHGCWAKDTREGGGLCPKL